MHQHSDSPPQIIIGLKRQNLHAIQMTKTGLTEHPGTVTLGITLAKVAHMRCFVQPDTSYHALHDNSHPRRHPQNVMDRGGGIWQICICFLHTTLKSRQMKNKLCTNVLSAPHRTRPPCACRMKHPDAVHVSVSCAAAVCVGRAPPSPSAKCSGQRRRCMTDLNMYFCRLLLNQDKCRQYLYRHTDCVLYRTRPACFYLYR